MIARRSLIALAALTGCDPGPPQLLVTVSTDLVVPAQVDLDRTLPPAQRALSPAAVIDRIHVEVDSTGPGGPSHDFLIHDTADLPFSFGVASPSGKNLEVRITGYRADWIDPAGGALLPPLGLTVTRTFRAFFLTSGAAPVSLGLHGGCLGRSLDPATGMTCTDGTIEGGLTADLNDDPQDAAAASWAGAHTAPCATTVPDGMVCIPGGLSLVGDFALATVDTGSDLAPAPPHLVRLSPFLLDQTEITVAEMRVIAATGKLGAPLPTAASADVHCNYTASPGAADDEAVRCVSYPTAAAACRVRGKVLPTAAQWEHAARGRGEGWRYPWGNDPPTCCAAALAAGATLGCDPDRDVGTHATTDQCPIADRSLDGVLDLAGGVREWVSDAPIGWGACLSTVVLDPLCGGSAMGSTKGGSLDTPLEGGSSALWRSGAGDGFDVGFRCALADN